MRVATIILGLLLTACATNSQPNDTEMADLIFVGDNVLTLDESYDNVSGVAVRGEKIVFVGDQEEALRLRGPSTELVRLGDSALLPGFIDAHGHFGFTARLIDLVNVSSPPVGSAETIDDIVALLAQRLNDAPLKKGQWLIGYGYDDSLLKENRHPNRDDLDRVTTEHPIVLMHVSGHLATTNSKALQVSGVTASTKNPPGGVIRRRPNSDEPNGVLEEKAAQGLVFGRIAGAMGNRFEELARQTARYYASFGITTAQDGAVNLQDLEILKSAAKQTPFAIDIGAYPFVTSLSKAQFDDFTPDSDYAGGVKLVGVKFSLDGSPQGRTAWLSQPYTEGPPGAEADYVAYPTMTPDYYKPRVKTLIERNIPVLVHANGDAAIDLMLAGIEEAVGETVPDHRSTIIHAQLMRHDQVLKAAQLKVIPSFFSAHTFFWETGIAKALVKTAHKTSVPPVGRWNKM